MPARSNSAKAEKGGGTGGEGEEIGNKGSKVVHK